MSPRDAVNYHLKNVRVVCKDGYTRDGKCYLETELDDDDELKVYLSIGFVNIPLEDIEEITEIKD